MNHSIIKTFCLLLGFLFIGCSSNNPEKAASAFLNAFNENDYEEARKYSTAETIKLIDLMENLSNLSEEPEQKGTFEIVNSKIDGDVAYVTYKEGNDPETIDIMLKKIDGKWLVHITKEDIATKDITDNPDEEGLWDDEPVGENSEETAPGGQE